MEHLNLETILSFIENIINSRETDEVENHLATCDRCHGIYMNLKAVERHLCHSFKDGKATASCPEDWEIGALVREEFPSNVSNKISEHIKDCSFCIDRAAVYYKASEREEMTIKTPESWKKKAFQVFAAGKTEEKTTFLQRIYNFIKDFTASLSPVPAYATAMVVILLLIILNVIPQKEKIITIASSEKIITRDSEIPSAFGFTGMEKSREVKNMEIQYKGRDIEFIWKPIDVAIGYEFSLRDKSEDKKVYSSHIGKKTMVSLKKDLFMRDRLYSWLIIGKTKDGKYFEYMGDFVLMK